MAEEIKDFENFSKELKKKNIKFLTDLELRKEIIYFFKTTSWKKIYEHRKTMIALGFLKESRDGFGVL